MCHPILCGETQHEHIIRVYTFNFQIGALNLQTDPNPHLVLSDRIKTYIIVVTLLLNRHNMIQHPMYTNYAIKIMLDWNKWRFLLRCYDLFDVEARVDGVDNFCIIV